MAYKKPLMIAGAVTTLGAATVLGLSTASAATNGEPTSLADKLATRFNLNKDEVQHFFDEDRENMKAQHQAQVEERLSQAVKDGKLTEEQKAKILAKFEELKAAQPTFTEMRDAAPGERKQIRLEKHDGLKQWAEENNIPEEYIRFALPGFGHKIMHFSEKGAPQEAN